MSQTTCTSRGRALSLFATAFLLFTTTAMASEAGASGEGGGPFEWFPFLAPFHSVVLHLPIGFVLLACILELYNMRRASDEGRRIMTVIHIFTVLAMVVTIALGLMRGVGGGYEEHTLSDHKWWGVAAGIVALATIAIHHVAFRKDRENGALKGVYRFLLASNFFILSMTGHSGGNLTYGSEYLVANAPEFVKKLLGEEEKAAGPAAATTAGETGEDPRMAHFLEKVWPALEAKCVRCHGEEKQKADYTLTDKEIAFKGGESEVEGIVPFNPARSFLVETILLPEDDDLVMPPEGKEPLTQEEITAIIQWIKDGAVWPEKLP